MNAKISRLILTLFLARWTAHWFTIAPCQSPERTINAYTGESAPYQEVTAQMCFKEHTRVKEKLFATKDEAATFLSNCPDDAKWAAEVVTCSDKSITEKSN